MKTSRLRTHGTGCRRYHISDRSAERAPEARSIARGGNFLRERLRTEFLVPVVARGEYLEGFDDPSAAAARDWVDSLKILNVTGEVALTYAAVARELRRAGRLIGANDLWIGCVARTAGLPLITHNTTEFRRIPGLMVLGYGD